MAFLLFLFVAASALTTLSSAETAQICETDDGVHGKLFVAQNNPDGTELDVLTADLSTSYPSNAHEFRHAANVPLPSSVTLSTDGVSDLQHERVVVTSTSIVTLTRDALVIVSSVDGQTVLVPIDTSCNPHRLYARSPDDVIYVLCRNKSRVFKLESGYELTEIDWDLTFNVDRPAVAFSNGEHVAAAVLKYDDEDYAYNWIEFKRDIEVDTNPVICEDTFYIDSSCDSAADRLLPFNNTHLILECKSTSQQYLLDIHSLSCFENNVKGVTSLELQQHAAGTAVGPDQDTFVVNYVTNVHVRRSHFKQSYVCDAGQPILRFDYVDANYIVLFTATATLRCSAGIVTNLSPLSISDQFLTYTVEGTRLFMATSSSSTAVTVYDVANACQFEFNSVPSISVPPGPLLVFAFVEGAPPTVGAPSTTTAQSSPSTSAVTSLTMASPTASTIIATTPPPSPPAAYVAVIVAVIVSSVAVIVAIVLTVCILLLCRKCGCLKLKPSPESPPESPSPSAQTLSAGSSAASLVSPVQETVDCPHIPAVNSPCSTGWTVQSSWEPRVVTPYTEVRPFLEHVPITAIAHQNPVPLELYLSDPVPECDGNWQYTFTPFSTQL